MNNRELIEQYRRWQQLAEPLVLATVFETAGSTYSKAGRHLLIDGHGAYAGLVGGGCLEGDLLEQANAVLAAGEARLVTYDMRDDADDVWGMGLGCRGMMRLLLQPLDGTRGWQPFADIATAMQAPAPTRIELVVDPAAGPRLGEHQLRPTDDAARSPELLTDVHGHRVLRWTVWPWPRLLVLGAGPDAVPVVRGARALGWDVTVADHREALVGAAGFADADRRVCAPADQLHARLKLPDFNAVIVMSHHLPSDQAYLEQLAQCEFDYVGVLGPAARREELLCRLQPVNGEFSRRLHGPVGFAIGADSPAGIALALLAEIHAALHAAQREGRA